ncbi:MAG: PEP-CTERM sorting domain-containing protein [Terracidiphilus sp.]
MKKFALALLALAVALAIAPKAHADNYNFGTVGVTVWNGTYSSGVTDTATLADQPTIASIATFDYTGPLDFVNNNCDGCSNTFAEFLNGADITNFASSESLADFLGSTMSSVGEVGSAINAYMEITGDIGTGTVTLASDDGSSLYLNGSNTALISMPGPQSLASETGVVSTDSSFELVYDESNGAPAVLQMSETPEPGTLLLLGTGLLGLALLAFRKAKSSPRLMLKM